MKVGVVVFPDSNSDVDDVASSSTMAYVSMSGLLSISLASASTTSSAAASESAVTVSSTRRPTRTRETVVMLRWGRLSSTARP